MVNTVVPLYYQIKERIRTWIINEEYEPGNTIPSEKELAALFNVNRLTVRQAVSHLVQEGILESKRGKGTFVTERRGLLNGFSLEFSGFMDDLFYQVSRSKTRSADIERVSPSKLIWKKLKLEEKEEEVVRISRVRFLAENSFAYTVNYLPLNIGEKIQLQELYKKPLLFILEQDLKIKFVEACQTIEATFAGKEIAKKLNIISGSPILFVERIMYGESSKPVEFVQSYYRGDMYKYIVRLKRERRKGKNVWLHTD
jgi:GntR family transcriptional regulator